MAYAALGKEYTIAITDWSILNKKATFDLPTEQVAEDIANAALTSARAQLPGLLDSVRSDVTFTVAKGALAALAIGAAAVLGYRYLASNR